jgi:hypothetical protein
MPVIRRGGLTACGKLEKRRTFTRKFLLYCTRHGFVHGPESFIYLSLSGFVFVLNLTGVVTGR